MPSKTLQHLADQVDADTRANPLNIGHAELAALSGDGRFDKRGFLSTWALDLAQSVFEFLACLRQRVEEEIDRWPGIVFALVPNLESFVRGLRSNAPCSARSGAQG